MRLVGLGRPCPPQRADPAGRPPRAQVPVLNPFPHKHSVLVIDQCKIHKVKDFQDIIKATGAILQYLPAYSPDKNMARARAADACLERARSEAPPALARARA